MKRRKLDKETAFFIVTFEDKSEKRKILNGIRNLVDFSVGYEYRTEFYETIGEISRRCRHEDKYHKGNEEAATIFGSDLSKYLSCFLLLLACGGNVLNELSSACSEWEKLYYWRTEVDKQEIEAYKAAFKTQEKTFKTQNKIIKEQNEFIERQSQLIDKQTLLYSDDTSTLPQ